MERTTAENGVEDGETSPIVEVVGVVGWEGLGGTQIPSEDHWTLTFTLDAWRIEGEDLQTQPLVVEQEVAEDLFDERFESLEELLTPCAVVRLRARLFSEEESGEGYALLEDVVGIDTDDAQLKEHVERLMELVVYQDPVLGTFTLDRRVDWFAGSLIRNDAPLALHISATEPPDLHEALNTARLLCESVEVWNQRMCSYAAEQLVVTKNESWLDDDEVPYTVEQFQQRIALTSITTYPDGSFEFWYNDNDLFLGHAIFVSGNFSEGPNDATIAG